MRSIKLFGSIGGLRCTKLVATSSSNAIDRRTRHPPLEVDRLLIGCRFHDLTVLDPYVYAYALDGFLE
ncbi:MAG: hypothetical protein WBN35_02735, partial [Acidimicrobiia bacterium]